MDKILSITLDTVGKQILFYLFMIIVVGLTLYSLYKIVQNILNWFKTGGKVNTKNLTVGGGFDSVKIPPHANCPHAADIMKVIAQTRQLTILEYKNPIITVESQMKYFEEKTVEIRALLLKIFVHELDNYLPEGSEVVQHAEYIAYDATLQAIYAQLKDIVRIIMRQNHFIEVTGDAWSKKKDRYKNTLVEKTTELLNIYWRGTIIPRWVLYDLNRTKENMEKINKILDDVFEFARDEALKADVKLKQASAEYEKFLATTITG